MNSFSNPYSGQKDVKRVTTDVSSADYYLIKSTRPGLATVTTVLGTLWKQLSYELRKRNITDFTHVLEFERFVANCRVVCDDDVSSDNTVKVDRAELEQLKLDSERWQHHLLNATGANRGGLSHGATGGSNEPPLAPNVGGGVTQSSPSDPAAQAVVPDVQSGGRKGRKRTKTEGGERSE